MTTTRHLNESQIAEALRLYLYHRGECVTLHAPVRLSVLDGAVRAEVQVGEWYQRQPAETAKEGK